MGVSTKWKLISRKGDMTETLKSTVSNSCHSFLRWFFSTKTGYTVTQFSRIWTWLRTTDNPEVTSLTGWLPTPLIGWEVVLLWADGSSMRTETNGVFFSLFNPPPKKKKKKKALKTWKANQFSYSLFHPHLRQDIFSLHLTCLFSECGKSHKILIFVAPRFVLFQN